jgi:cytochrome c peroxidase
MPSQTLPLARRFRHFSILHALASAAVLLSACGGQDAPVDPTPTVADPVLRRSVNPTLVATVGTAVSFDPFTVFDIPAGAVVTRTVTLSGVSGLTGGSGVIVGSATAPGVGSAIVRVTPSEGEAVADTFAVVAFAPGLVSPSLPLTSFAYSDASRPLPAHFRGPGGPGGSVIGTDNMSASNPTTDAGATLGRVLFYDTRLSRNDAIACASCHLQSTGFADTVQFSRGIDGQRTPRHSMALANARFYQRGRFFWDERAATLEDQVVQPISDPGEMALPLPDALEKLRATPFYAPLFAAAFGSADITGDRVARALAQFVRSMVSGNATHDQAFAAGGPPNFAAVFTAQQLQGHQLFIRDAGCARCHITDAQVGSNIMNNGLDAVLTDLGAGGGRFKSPSLRNVGVRRFFMHDGRFTSLDQVVAHYDSGIQNSPGLDPGLRQPGGQPQRLNLTAGERAALVAYLHTLTDSSFLTDVRFSDPFGR